MKDDCECFGDTVIQAELALVIIFFLILEAKQKLKIYGITGYSQNQGNKDSANQENNANQDNSGTKNQNENKDTGGKQDNNGSKANNNNNNNKGNSNKESQWYQGW
ncbi:hypothetical protein [Paradesulfitobacterium ferrireducens]|uniref:hypothetical protein n=1 Tax=Paradesulfitobacterium ferrireducens TaxID=2816476 RepID=UPI001A8CA739|nr:hypothetical protein [Paradesulfitobacterium ferrireducens]